MATKTYKFTGITKWAKVREPDEMYQNYQVPLYLDAESRKAFDESGLRLTVKKDDDGEYATFKRKHVEMNYKKMAQEVNGPPSVAINEDGEYKPFDGLIGNGSKISVWVDVYDTRNGKGHRLKGVGIEDLVVYNPDGASEDSVKMPF